MGAGRKNDNASIAADFDIANAVLEKKRENIGREAVAMMGNYARASGRTVFA
jgi:hypothetical protein